MSVLRKSGEDPCSQPPSLVPFRRRHRTPPGDAREIAIARAVAVTRPPIRAQRWPRATGVDGHVAEQIAIARIVGITRAVGRAGRLVDHTPARRLIAAQQAIARPVARGRCAGRPAWTALRSEGRVARGALARTPVRSTRTLRRWTGRGLYTTQRHDEPHEAIRPDDHREPTQNRHARASIRQVRGTRSRPRLDTGRTTFHATRTVNLSIDSGIYTLAFCAAIILVFAGAWRHLRRERNRLAALNSYIMMKYRLGVKVALDAVPATIADDIARVEDAGDPVRRKTGFEKLWKRAVRLESSVDFWVDLLQKLGLLGTVLGLGFALAIDTGSVADLLGPLSTAVWTTVAGLLCSIIISWRFGRDMDVEVDAHEEHLEEWQAAFDDGRGRSRRAGSQPEGRPQAQAHAQVE